MNSVCMLRTLLLVWGVGLLVSSCSPKPKHLPITIRFENASGLQVGDDLQISGVIVGEIVELDLTADQRVVASAKVIGDYRNHVTMDTKFRIRKESLISGRKYLELIPGKDEPVADHAEFVVPGSPIDQFLEWGEEVRKKLDDPALEEGWSDLVDSGERALERGKEEWEKLRPELEKRAVELIEKAKETAPQVADRLRSELEGFLEAGDLEVETQDPDQTI